MLVISNKLLVFFYYLAILTIPLSLSASYIAVLPLVLFHLVYFDLNTFEEFVNSNYIKPLIIFIVFGLFTAIFGIRPMTSWPALLGLLIWPATIFVFIKIISFLSKEKSILLLVAACGVSSFHSLLESAYPQNFKKLFIGTVTESGQLALIIPLLVGSIFYLYRNISKIKKIQRAKTLIHFIIAFVLFLTFGLSNYLSYNKLLISTLAIIFLIHGYFHVYKVLRYPNKTEQLFSLLFTTFLPLLSSALIINLKRGPWLGVAVALLIFSVINYKKMLIPIILVTITLITTVNPISTRLQESSRDFFIHGGRSTIWDVGLELITKYPLGIGFENSSFLREYAPQVPPELVHFHNNLLNITVEFGWLGLGLFIWWLLELFRLSFINNSKDPINAILVACGCSLIAWQTAGLVEYNFGDSEVLFILCFVIAMASVIKKDSYKNTSLTSDI
jgi:O-antigen ligase